MSRPPLLSATKHDNKDNNNNNNNKHCQIQTQTHHQPNPSSETKSDQQAEAAKTPYLSAAAAKATASPQRPKLTGSFRQEHKGANVYYYASPASQRAMPAGSQASSQRTNETTCDESPCTTDAYGYSNERHLYAALAPLAYDQHLASVAPVWRPPANQALCVDQKLVHSEPLIRSSSWQNRTLVDLHRPHQQQQRRPELVQHVHQPSLHYLESSLVHKTLPVCYSQAALVAKMNEPPVCSGSSSSDSAMGPLGRPLHLAWPATSKRRRPLVPRPRSCALASLLLLMLGLLLGSLLLLVPPQPPSATTNTPFNYQPDSSPVVEQPAFGGEPHSGAVSPPLPQPTLAPPAAAQPASPPPPLPPLPPPKPGQPEPEPDDETGADRWAPSEPPEAIESSTQPYWQAGTTGRHCMLPGDRLACNQRGQCTALGACACLASFSGPTCAQANCPNDCSQRGLCRLRPESTLNRLGAGQPDPHRRAHLESVAFQSLSGSPARNSLCPGLADSERNHTWAKLSPADGSAHLFDHRLEWACECAPGYKGADCSKLREMHCDDGKDNDHDGLLDCEDEDCCAHPSCRDNLMCFQSVEPASVLARADSARPQPVGAGQSAGFFARHAFLIANDSVQSYAHEHEFDAARAAVVRGRVVRRAEPERGIVSVRVSVIENTQLGFTLTRSDGYFDLLVNGNDWITLLLHRNGYTTIKRRLRVRALAINSMIEPVEMWPLEVATAPAAAPTPTGTLAGAQLAQASSSAAEPVAALRTVEPRPLPVDSFNLRARLELHRLAATISRRPNGADDDRRLRQKLEACLLDQLARPQPDALNFEPRLLNLDAHKAPEVGEPLRAFAMASANAFESRLRAATTATTTTTTAAATTTPAQSLEPTYSSATFPPASSVVKPTVAVQLLPADVPTPASLERIIVQLDIEGQTRHEHLQPESGLIYQFAWNRRNVYDQKVYGFGRLNLRVGYELRARSQAAGSRSQQAPLASVLSSCLEPDVDASQLQAAGERLEQQASLLAPSTHVIWFERQVFMEANQVNQLADVGRWALPSLNRLDPERNLIYMADGWTLPFGLVYPPVLLDRTSALVDPVPEMLWQGKQQQADQATGRLLSSGPSGSLFLIQLGQSSRLIQFEAGSSHRRLLDLPLSILTSKLGLPSSPVSSADDIQLLYNNYAQTLYLSSRSMAKLVQVSLASLQVLNKTLANDLATAPAEDEIDIEPLLGFGRQWLSQLDWTKPSRNVRLLGPHSMALDEERQLLYLLDGPASLLALDLRSNYVSLLLGGQPQASLGSARRVRPSGGGEPLSPRAPDATACRRAERILAPGSWQPSQRMHSLVWNRADSSLYFVERDVVYGLRQDMSLEMVAFGSSSPHCKQDIRLGSVKTLSVDQASADLLIVHQARKTSDSPRRTLGRFYLAKIVSAMRTSKPDAEEQQQASPLVDLHSSAAWDPLITRVAKWHSGIAPIINWPELASPFERIPQGAYVQVDQAKRIPFIHLTAGLDRLDSLEIGPDGSIFVLDFGANSIKLIDFYSPSHFNLLEHRYLDTNRLFAAGSQPSGPTEQRAPANRKLQVLMVQNPISSGRQLMEFHWSSGLQLSMTSLPAAGLNQAGIKHDFYYSILAGNKLMDMDEDDKLDLSAKHLLSDYLTMMASAVDKPIQAMDVDDRRLAKLPAASSASLVRYIRLHEISDSNGNSYKLVRAFTGSKYVIRSILLNNQLYAELTTDYLGVLSSYKLFEGDEARLVVEIVYDSLTYLIRDIITKTSVNALNNSKTTSLVKSPIQAQAKMKVQQKRVVYDRIFYHYCDLFIIDS